MSDQTSGGSLTELVDEFFKAYNDVDGDALDRLLDKDVHWEHHNHFAGDGSAGLIESIKRISGMIPDRAFSDAIRVTEVGSLVYREHRWTGTPTETLEGFPWEAGVPATMDVLSVFAFDAGRISEWSDYA